MDLRVSLHLIFFCLPLIRCSCFVPTPCTTIRQFIRIIDPCNTVTECENACLGDTECEAYKLVNVKCALMGADSGRPQICTSGDPTCFVRAPACDDATITSTSASITSSTTTSSTQTTTTTTSASTTTTTTVTGCSDNLIFDLPSPCVGCDDKWFIYDNIEFHCDNPDNTLYRSGDNTVLGWLTCTNDEWISSEGSVTVAPQTRVFCGPSSASCMGLTYAVPSDSVGCVQPDFGDTQVSCAAGYDLYELGAGEVSTLIQGTLDCVSGQWTDGTTIVPANTAMYCKPQQPVTTTTTAAATTTTTKSSVCAYQPYDAPALCGGCLSPTVAGVQTYCSPGYDLYTFDAPTQTSTKIGWPLECINGDWRDLQTVIPAGTNLYCAPRPAATTTAATTTTTSSVCAELSYEAPAACSGVCMAAEWIGTQTYCRPDYELYTYDGAADSSTLTSGLLQCENGVWYDGATEIPDTTTVYCKPVPTTTTTTTEATTTTTAMGCGDMTYEPVPVDCDTCEMPYFLPSKILCTSNGMTLFTTADSTNIGSLNCVDNAWTAEIGGGTYAALSRVYCNSKPCAPLTVGFPSTCGSCYAPTLAAAMPISI